MNEQIKKILIKLGVIIILAALLLVVLEWRGQEPATPQENSTDTPTNSQSYIPDAIVVDYNVMDGIHTLRGTVSLPNPCYTMETKIATEPGSESVTLVITAMPAEGDVMCIQQIDERSFSVDFQAPINPSISATFNGRNVPLVITDNSGTLIPRGGL